MVRLSFYMAVEMKLITCFLLKKKRGGNPYPLKRPRIIAGVFHSPVGCTYLLVHISDILFVLEQSFYLWHDAFQF